jgi:hypothetical protein
VIFKTEIKQPIFLVENYCFSYLRVIMRKRKIEIPLKLVELENENYHIMVETRFPDGFKGMWIVDTGASKTVIDSNLENYYSSIETPLTEIESMGIGNAKVETKSGIIETIFVGDICLNNLQVALIDLSPINQLYQKFAFETIAGLIGSDFLVQHKAIINFKKMTMQLWL